MNRKKHIVCFGDSNTHGYCADPEDTETHSDRFSENERWTCLLQKALGEDFYIIEEGLSGRTTVFDDALHEKMSGLDSIYSCLMSHEPVDLLIIMLGTNDCKERFGANPAAIAVGLDRLIRTAKAVPAWSCEKPNILIICPPWMREGFHDEVMGLCCVEKSPLLAKYFAPIAEANGCAFLDAEGIAEFNTVDFTHLSRKGHAQLAEKLAKLLPTLLS